MKRVPLKNVAFDIDGQTLACGQEQLEKLNKWLAEVTEKIDEKHRGAGMGVLVEHFKARDYFLRCAKRTTNLASINMTQLRALPVVLPSMDVQREFVEHFYATRSIQTQQSTATANAHSAFDALLARCFDALTAE